ncbi:hypothetical protein B0H13DRAFT_2414196 [Mycena leptocephala]|nr:hypothetical protein B0H13DRAFT_2414196 [Mycena leptocephala]
MPYSPPGAASGSHFHFHRDEDSSDSEDGALNTYHHNAHIPSPRPRAASTPVPLLSNGKQLKSSLKSSSSESHLHNHRLRTWSASSLVSCSSLPSASSAKVVHFPAPDAGLEEVTVFKLRACPANVLIPLNDQTETDVETEAERDVLLRWGGAVAVSPRSPSPPSPSPLTPHAIGAEWGYALYTPDVPCASDAGSMVLLETMCLAGVGARAPSGFSPWTPHDASLTSTQTDADGPLTLVGTLLAHNAAFEKHLSVHFTLDGWSTTSDVCARYVDAGTAVHPPSLCSPPPVPGPGWDRFAFHIPLADYAGKDAEMGGLCARELALAVRFTAPYVRADGVAPYIWCAAGQGHGWTGTGAAGTGEWWDNNEGRDYRASFRWVHTHQDTGPHIKTAIPETRPRLAFTSRTTFPSSSGAAPAPARPPYEVGKAADTYTTRPALGPQAQAGVSRV